MKKILVLFSLFLLSITLFSQINPTSASDRNTGLEKRKTLEENSLLKNISIKNVGPTIMSGRVTDIEVNPANPVEFYVSYASGGLWYTENNGHSFAPIFDHEDVITIGDFAVNWSTGCIVVGAGEVNSSRSSYAGNGMYKSFDQGKNWEYIGLPESHHIGKVLIHPTNDKIIFVAALGHLYSANKERGIYKTSNGGKTWKQVLFIDENTGGIDLNFDPSNAETIYAAMWHRERRAWNFIENGSGSGIYKSTNGGETWNNISTANSGFPNGEGVGRIGIAVAENNSNIIYAILDNQFNKPDTSKTDTTKISLKQLKDISKEAFLQIEESKLDSFLIENHFPHEYSAKKIKEKIEKNEWQPTVLNEFLNLGDYDFNTPTYGCEVYKSNDGGMSWNKTHTDEINGMFFTYGYYFSKIYVDPKNQNKIYILGYNLLMSDDGGNTFKNITQDNVHPDHHALWINPNDDGHLINGNDGGINITYDDGKVWINANNPAVGQFYSVEVDDANPYNIYGGLQDNGVWFGPSNYVANNYWMSSGEYPYQSIYGGDGMQVRVDTRDNQTIYTGYQFGFYARLNNKNEEISIRPSNVFGENALRFNWQTPIWLSKHNQDVFYYGSNKFYRSLNKGENLIALSADLTNGKKTGNVPYGTITSIHESPKKFGLIYCGTDDGNIWVSKDGGYNWIKISDKLPKGLWVSRVNASAHDEGTVFISLNGYRFDHFNPYLFMSNDFGNSWIQIGTDLPFEPINIVKEDPKNKNVLYVGTDNGLYISLNQGKNFMSLQNQMPRVAVHDLAIQERENDLVIGTHGRSIFIMQLDEIQMLDTILQKEIFVFENENINYSKYWGSKYAFYAEPYLPEHTFHYYVNKNTVVNYSIETEDGTKLFQESDSAEVGLNNISYACTISESNVDNWNIILEDKKSEYQVVQSDDKKYYLIPGNYFFIISDSLGTSFTSKFIIEDKK